MKITGTVEKITSSPGQYGMMHRVTVDNVMYGTGKTAPPVNVGDYVEFEAEQKGQYWNANAATFRVRPMTNAPQVLEINHQAPVERKAWVPDKDRQDSITYQSARKDALEMTSLLLNSNALDFGKAKTVAAKVELVEMYVDKFTIRFFEDTKRLAPPEHPQEAVKTKAAPATDDNFGDDDIPF